MSDYDYGEDEHSAVDSDDDDDVAFVPAGGGYTTFGNENNPRRRQHRGKDEATYGIFLGDDTRESKRSRASSSAPAPMFVKGETVVDKEEEKDTNEVEIDEATDQKEAEDAIEQEDEEKKLQQQEEESHRKEQDAANARFYALLGRGRGDARSRRSMFRDEATTEPPPPAEPRSVGGLGLGAAAPQAAGGLGLGVATAPVDNEASSSQFAGLGMPSQFGGIGYAEKEEPVRVDPNLGKWEKHTKGIGMKLLTKMGYKGSGGLGAKRIRTDKTTEEAATDKPRKGISRPVEVVVRPTNLGLGFGNFKEATKLKVNRQIEAEVRGVEVPKAKEDEKHADKDVVSSSALPSTQDLLKAQSWRKGSSRSKKRKRTVVPYKELLETQQQPVVIDMRGPQESATSADGEPKEVPLAEELLHNVTVLLNTYENKLHSSSHFVKSTKRKLDSLHSDVDDMTRRKKEAEERISKLQTVLRIMDEIDALETSDERASKVQSLVQQLRDSFTQEERVALKFDQVLAPSLVAPLIQSRLQGWNPLGDNLSTTKRIISETLKLGATDSMDAVSMDMKRTIFTNHILPRVQKAFESTKWDPVHQVENALQLYETLIQVAQELSPVENNKSTEQDHQVFPSDGTDSEEQSMVKLARQQVMLDTIAPKLSRRLSQWSPELDGNHLADRLDLWILPWISHLDHPGILPELVNNVRRKVRSDLSFLQRNLGDDADFLIESLHILKPWKNVIQLTTLHELTSKYATPRLARCLANFTVSRDPKTQDWSTIDLLFQWNDSGLLPEREFLSLVEGEVMSNWIDALYMWLDSSQQIDMAALADFYSEWKMHLFGIHSSNAGLSIVRDDDMVCRMFYSGVVLIKCAQDGSDLYEPSQTNYQTVLARRTKEARKKLDQELRQMDLGPSSNGVPHKPVSRPKGVPATFRDVVEEFARDRDVIFQPRMGANSIKDGKPVFMFGQVPIYFDSNVIFALRDKEWKPLSLDQLAGMV